MIFSSTVFLFIFLPILLLVYYCRLVKSNKVKKYNFINSKFTILCIWRTNIHISNDYINNNQLYYRNIY